MSVGVSKKNVKCEDYGLSRVFNGPCFFYVCILKFELLSAIA